MTQVKYGKFLNFIWYEAVWFAAVLGREGFEIAIVALIGLHLFLCRDEWQEEAKLIIVCGIIGVTADSLLALAGVYIFTPAPGLLPIPLWLAGLWIGFAGTFRNSMQYFILHPRIGMIAGALFAPLSYFAAARLGAVAFGVESYIAALAIGVSWGLMMVVFSFVTRRILPEQIEADASTIDTRQENEGAL